MEQILIAKKEIDDWVDNGLPTHFIRGQPDL